MTRRTGHLTVAAAVVPVLACSRPATDAGLFDTAASLQSVTRVSRCAEPLLAASAVREARDVTYVVRDGRPLRFDVAWTEGGPRAPLVLLLHGGSWSAGSRASLHDEMRALARRGYTAATVEYRLTRAPRDVFPAAIADVRC